MDSLVDIIKAAWPIVATFGNVAALAAFAWMKSQFATKADHRELDDKVDRHGERLVRLEADDTHEPTRADLNRITYDLGQRIAGLESANKAFGHQLQTANTYLRTIIETGLKK